METAYLVTANLIRYFAGWMARRSGGQIVVIGSYQGVVAGLPACAVPSATHNAVWGLCESVRDELRKARVALSYLVAFRFDEAPQTKEHLLLDVESLFPVLPPSVQADILMDGLTNKFSPAK